MLEKLICEVITDIRDKGDPPTDLYNLLAQKGIIILTTVLDTGFFKVPHDDGMMLTRNKCEVKLTNGESELVLTSVGSHCGPCTDSMALATLDAVQAACRDLLGCGINPPQTEKTQEEAPQSLKMRPTAMDRLRDYKAMDAPYKWATFSTYLFSHGHEFEKAELKLMWEAVITDVAAALPKLSLSHLRKVRDEYAGHEKLIPDEMGVALVKMAEKRIADMEEQVHETA